jgi:hypothetical protein
MRYYFHVQAENGTALDDQGTELPDLAAAHREASASARELLARAIKDGHERLPERIAIMDAAGHELATVRLKDMLPSSLRAT